MSKDKLTIYDFASDADNKKMSNKKLAEKAAKIAEQRNKEADIKEEIEFIKKQRRADMEKYDYERKKPLIDEIAKRRTSTEGSFKKGGSVMSRGNKLSRSKPTKIC